MPIRCPSCSTDLEVERYHSWPYIRTSILLHLESCAGLHCDLEQRATCAESLADVVANEEPPVFKCPFGKC
ncbi:MAG TPA: hypothetical protein VNA04_15865 [Thermoanaerobaculia bacterium]|nr:hypothetical protein [Thermoanaerobaculia bacterium]